MSHPAQSRGGSSVQAMQQQGLSGGRSAARGGTVGSSSSSGGAPSAVGSAKVRAMELFNFWLLTAGGQAAIRDLVAETMEAAEGTDSAAAATASSSSAMLAGRNSGTTVSKVAVTEEDTASRPLTLDLGPSLATTGGASQVPPDPQILIGMDDLPSVRATQREEETTSVGSSGSPERSFASLDAALGTTLGGSSSGSGHGSVGRRNHNRTSFSPHKSPREVKLGGLTSHMVDEVDAAHMRGALSPRSLSPAAQLLNQDLHMQGASPFDGSLSTGDVPRRAQLLHLDSSSMVSASRRVDGSESTLSSRSTSPSTNDDSIVSARPGGLLARTRSSSLSALQRFEEETVKKRQQQQQQQRQQGRQRHATYQEVPRFYWAEGKPQTTSTQLEGPHYRRDENPHLVIHDGVAIPLGGGMVLTAEPGQPPLGPRTAPLLPLAIMEDEDVGPFIQREFATLPQPPAAGGGSSLSQGGLARKGVAKGGPLRRPSTSHQRGEQQYQQQLMLVMRRVVTQAFGLPAYFTRLIFEKLVTFVPAAAAGVSGAAPRSPVTPPMQPLPTRPGSSSSSSAQGGLQGQRQGQQGHMVATITATVVKEFYEKHLRFKSIVRRMFETLVATSKHSAADGAHAAGNGDGTGASSSGSSGGGSSPATRRNYLVRADLLPYLQVLLESHPGLAFLRQTSDFQMKYVEAVLVRIFYDLDRRDRGRITWPEFEQSKLPDAIRQVDVTEDINTVLNFFSYEHFYVLYCRFWELDEDKDLMLGPADLARYGPENTFNPQIVERIFRGNGRRLKCDVPGKMCFEDFVWFCLSEEDKTTPRAIRYWFRILDEDGDGVISGFELEAIYEFTRSKLLQMTSEAISFTDVMCQIKDMLPTMRSDGLRLEDLLRAPHSAHVAINMICNVAKFLLFEQRDPFVAHHDRLAGGFEKTEWDRFARMEYDRMASEADEEQ